jgi:hypothetical protein
MVFYVAKILGWWYVYHHRIREDCPPYSMQMLIISASPNVEITSPGRRARGYINPCIYYYMYVWSCNISAILVIKQLQQMTTYRKFRKWNTEIGFRNRERLFPVLPIIKTFLTCDRKHTCFKLCDSFYLSTTVYSIQQYVIKFVSDL